MNKADEPSNNKNRNIIICLQTELESIYINVPDYEQDRSLSLPTNQPSTF